jgi:hypothetical protein
MKSKQNICKNLTFQDCELAILRTAVDKAVKKIGSKSVNSEDIKKMIAIVETFIRDKKLICYGGTAINNILPKQDQFYDKDAEIPDYDFFSDTALIHAKELCDIFFANGYIEVEGKAGQHYGTYKVFVNFIPIADITYIPKELFFSLKKEAIRVGGILYPPANFLRMNMYKELSRPDGDVDRWEKVLKRLTLLNKHYPLLPHNCKNVEFQREMQDKQFSEKIYENVKHVLIDQGVVFFGGYSLSLYSKYMPNQFKKHVEKIPDFDVFTENPKLVSTIIQERLEDVGIKNIKIVKHPAVYEMISENYEVLIKNGNVYDSIVFIYEPLACHSYNTINEQGMLIKVATIDTMLSFYLAFLYANRKYYNTERILCMAAYLFDVQEKNRLEQKGVLKRFSINCIGHQDTVEEMRAKKSEKFKELKHKRNSLEYEEWFLRYRPFEMRNKRKNKTTKANKKIRGEEEEEEEEENTTPRKTKPNKYTTNIKTMTKTNTQNKTKKNKKQSGILDFLKFKDV